MLYLITGIFIGLNLSVAVAIFRGERDHFISVAFALGIATVAAAGLLASNVNSIALLLLLMSGLNTLVATLIAYSKRMLAS